MLADLWHLTKFLFVEPTALVPHEPTTRDWWGDPEKINGYREQHPL